MVRNRHIALQLFLQLFCIPRKSDNIVQFFDVRWEFPNIDSSFLSTAAVVSFHQARLSPDLAELVAAI